MGKFEELNEGLLTITEHLIKSFSDVCVKDILKGREEQYKSLLDFFDVDKIKAARKARIADKRSTRQNRGRPKKNCVDSVDNPADIDSDVTIRSTRRAAQVAMVKNKTMLSLHLNHKCRRPSNFNEAPSSSTTTGKQKRTHISSPVPPTKYRRVLNKPLAGNVNTSESTENNLQSEEDLFGSTQIVSNKGENTNNPTIIDEDIKKDSENCKRTSDCIVTTSNVTSKSDTKIPTYVDKSSTTYKQLTAVTVVPIENYEQTKFCGSLDSGISEGAYGHHEHSNNVNIVQNKNYKENTAHPITENGNTEIEAEATTNRFRTKPIKKNTVHKDNDQVKNDEVEAESKNTRCRTKILKKKVVNHEENDKLGAQGEASSVIDKDPVLVEDLSVPSAFRTKRKGAKKHSLCNEVVNIEKTEKEPSPIRTRTKVIKKAKEDVVFEDSGALNNTTSRNINNNKMANNLIRDVTNLQESTPEKVYVSKTHSIFELPKGELVKKRVEEIEKVNTFADKNLAENGGRVTRTKTRAMRGTSAFTVVDQSDATVMVQKDVLEECGKENMQSDMASIQQRDGNNDKEKIPGTPLADYNRVETTTFGSTNKFVVTCLSGDKYKSSKLSKVFVHKLPQNDLKMRQKEENAVKKQKQVHEATKKKEQTLKATAEQARRKREEKLKKVAAAREAAEKKKATLAMKLEEEQKEKSKQILLEKEKQKEEIAKKKLIYQQKLHEAEERRKQEEAARLAKLKEQEEEQKRLQANREKELEAAERLNQKRQLEELRAKEAEKTKKNANLKLHKVATANAKLKKDVKTAASSYSITPHRDERPVLKPKSENDYGIEDVKTDDSSDDESKPKKMIPLWARAGQREKDLYIQSKYVSLEVRKMFMSCNKNPDLKAIFSEEQQPRRIKPRTSSAVWTSPVTD